MSEKLVSQVSQTVEVVPPGQRLRRPPRKADGPAAETDPLKSERVEEKLRAAPSWRIFSGGQMVQKSKQFPGKIEAMLYSSFVSSIASSLNVPVEVRLLGLWVVVTLQGLGRKGQVVLSDAQLDFAVLIS
jgi:pterin-4a-carbinolamine dehydratase